MLGYQFVAVVLLVFTYLNLDLPQVDCDAPESATKPDYQNKKTDFEKVSFKFTGHVYCQGQ